MADSPKTWKKTALRGFGARAVFPGDGTCVVYAQNPSAPRGERGWRVVRRLTEAQGWAYAEKHLQPGTLHSGAKHPRGMAP